MKLRSLNTSSNLATKQKNKILILPKLTCSSTQTIQQRRDFTQNRVRNLYYATNTLHIYVSKYLLTTEISLTKYAFCKSKYEYAFKFFVN
jgi:hypothetical protein